MDAWLALRSTIWKTLEYPLIFTTLIERQCDQIIQPEISAGLAKSHICRSFPTSLSHTGAEAVGAVLHHHLTVQGIARMSTLLCTDLRMLLRGELFGALILEMAIDLNLGNGANIFMASLLTIKSLETW
jgi:hypothetical protein